MTINNLLDIAWLISQFIMGDFKRTVLGGMLVLLAFGVYSVIRPLFKNSHILIRILIATVLVCVFLYFGHEIVDPWFHQIESWMTTPLGEPMHLDLGN